MNVVWVVLQRNCHIVASERRQLIPHVRFQVPFLGPESQLKSNLGLSVHSSVPNSTRISNSRRGLAESLCPPQSTSLPTTPSLPLLSKEGQCSLSCVYATSRIGKVHPQACWQAPRVFDTHGEVAAYQQEAHPASKGSQHPCPRNQAVAKNPVKKEDALAVNTPTHQGAWSFSSRFPVVSTQMTTCVVELHTLAAKTLQGYAKLHI